MKYLIFLCLSFLLSVGAACGESEPSFSIFSIVADEIPGGVLLGVDSVGDEAIFVGGPLGGSGKGIIARYQGDTLCIEENVSDGTLWWIHSARPGEWYAVGERGTIVHSVNGVRTVESVATSAILYGVYDMGDRVVAVGGDLMAGEGEAWVRSGGGTWTQLASGLPGVLFKIWGNWIVGKGVAYHLEGDQLVERFPPNGETLLTVVGQSDDEVWAVGGLSTPTILHWKEGTWSSVPIDASCTNQGLNGVWTEEGEELWVAGFFGAMGSFDGTRWNCPTNVLTYEHFHAVTKHNDEVLWAGGSLYDQGDLNFGTIGRFGKKNTSVVPTACPPN